MANTKRFHRHFETPGLPLYWIIIAYIILGWFSPVIGLLALICMIGPVVTSIFKGRWWCGLLFPNLCAPLASDCLWYSLSSACSASS